MPATLVESSKFETLEICEPDYFRAGRIRFRWLEISRYHGHDIPPVAIDVWSLDNVTIMWTNGEHQQTLLKDDFESQNLK